MKTRVECPTKYSGPLTAVLRDTAPENRAAVELRWYRAQMRSWAGHWRRRAEEAAILGKDVAEIARMNLDLAKVYRDGSRKLGAR